MKLISLNTWGGKVFQPLMDFIKKQSEDTDVFCLQEIYSTASEKKEYSGIRANLLQELIKLLHDFQYYYSVEISGYDETASKVDFDLTVGKAIFLRKNLKVEKAGEIVLYGSQSEKFLKKDFSNLAIVVQNIEFIFNNESYTVFNIHGTAFPSHKLDTALRLAHSVQINEILKDTKTPKILAGDFNLLPQSESIAMLEQNMRNLIKEFNIDRTRSRLSPFWGRADFQKFADYVFTSPEINVGDFTVADIDLSDHLPMILQFS